MKDDRAQPKREALVDQALKILGDRAHETNAALYIDYAIQAVQWRKNQKQHPGDHSIQTKVQKKATQRLAVALRRTVLALKDPNLPLEVRLLLDLILNEAPAFDLMLKICSASRPRPR